MNYIQNFEYHNLWNKYNVCWHQIHEDVNILVGINGKVRLLCLMPLMLITTISQVRTMQSG